MDLWRNYGRESRVFFRAYIPLKLCENDSGNQPACRRTRGDNIYGATNFGKRDSGDEILFLSALENLFGCKVRSSFLGIRSLLFPFTNIFVGHRTGCPGNYVAFVASSWRNRSVGTMGVSISYGNKVSRYSGFRVYIEYEGCEILICRDCNDCNDGTGIILTFCDLMQERSAFFRIVSLSKEGDRGFGLNAGYLGASLLQ